MHPPWCFYEVATTRSRLYLLVVLSMISACSCITFSLNRKTRSAGQLDAALELTLVVLAAHRVRAARKYLRALSLVSSGDKSFLAVLASRLAGKGNLNMVSALTRLEATCERADSDGATLLSSMMRRMIEHSWNPASL